MKMITRTATMTNAKLAIATLALFAAGSAAFIVTPNGTSVTKLKQNSANKSLKTSDIGIVQGGNAAVVYHFTDGSSCTDDEQYSNSCNNRPCIHDPQRNRSSCALTNIAQGRPCLVGAQCAQGLTCISSNPLDDPAQVTNILFAGRCGPMLQTGASCARFDQCASGRCSLSTHRCATPLPANTACNPQNDTTNCAPPLRCRYETYTGTGGHTGTLVCRQPLPDNARCDDGSNCSSNRCVEANANTGGGSSGPAICSTSIGY